MSTLVPSTPAPGPGGPPGPAHGTGNRIPDPSETTEPSPRGRTRNPWHRLALRLHFYAGILVGPFLLVAALSGALYAVSPQIEEAVQHDALHVAPSSTTVPLADQISAAEAVVGRPADAIRPAKENGATTRVMFVDPTLPSKSDRRAVFVDPGTGRVVDDLTVYGTSGSLPARTWIDRLHRQLLLGEPGRWYSELAASWLWVVTLGGLVLWVSSWRRTRRAAGLVYPHRPGRSRRAVLGWHASIGVWAAVGLLMLSATGLTWSTFAGDRVGDIRTALGWTTPKVNTTLATTAPTTAAGGHEEHEGHAAHAAPTTSLAQIADSALVAARADIIDAPWVEIGAPAETGKAVTVTEIGRRWPMQSDSVAIDPTSGVVVDRVEMAKAGLVPNLVAWGISLHMGSLFGWPNQLALFALGLGLGTMVVLGYVMWWQRRPRHTPGLVGRPTPRGALAELPRPTLLVLGASLAALTWLIPLFGWPLLAFLAIDAALGHRARRA